MLTIFSIPKPFRGHVGIIQRNAIHSWFLLHPKCEIVLCGDELGSEETASQFGAKFIPHVDRNEHGTPFLNSAFDQVKQIASHPLLCYANADIILLSDLLRVVQRIRFQRFLVVGQRWDLGLAIPWDFQQPNWEDRLRTYVARRGARHPPSGGDYFVFPRDSVIAKFPPFVVGRPGWDNWFIYRARKLGIPVVDVTRVVTAIHQNHDYTHVPNQGGEMWEGVEADRNRKLMGTRDHFFTLLDATHVIKSQAPRPALAYRYMRRRWQSLPVLVPTTRPLIRFLRACFRSWHHLVSYR